MTDTAVGTVHVRVDGRTREMDEKTAALALYRQMVTIRRFEDAVQSLFLKSHIFGTTHLYSGQEASGVGVISMLGDEDIVAATYRCHGAALALGTTPQSLMDEMCGRATGVCGGRAGSMNVVDLEHGLMGSFGIVGATMGAASGAALSWKQKGLDRVAVAFFGDGATNQAYFHECLNFAQVEKLPVLFVCENNLYMEYTPTHEVTAGAIIDRPKVFGIHTESVDGNDVWAVREATARALAHIRSGAGPAFIENRTYRLVGHSRSDPAKYRKPGELDEWKRKEPLVIERARLVDQFGYAEEQLSDLEREVAAEIERVADQSLSAPWPDPAIEIQEYAP